MNYFEQRVEQQIAAERAKCAEQGWEFNERGVDNYTTGDLVRAVLAIETPEDAGRFYEGHVALIQRQIDAGTWASPRSAEDSARANIGWCFGEGMSPERMAMWNEVCQAAHPIFGAKLPSPHYPE